jgi:hypothetical protein
MDQMNNHARPGLRWCTFAEWERQLAGTSVVPWAIVTGLPALGILAALVGGLPLFAAFMVAVLLLGTALLCHRGLTTFAGPLLQHVVTVRVIILLVMGAFLICASEGWWMIVVSALLIWLVAERLLGQRALHELWRLGQAGPGQAAADRLTTYDPSLAEDSPSAPLKDAANGTTASPPPPPSDGDLALLGWVADQRNAGVSWSNITRATAQAGHVVAEKTLRGRLRRRQGENNGEPAPVAPSTPEADK